MPKATITFNKVIQGSQNYESFDKNENYMVSEIHFTLEVKGKQYENMHVEIRQPCGTNYEEEPIEVGEIIKAGPQAYLKDRQIGVDEEITCMTDSQLANAFDKRNPGGLFEKAAITGGIHAEE